MHFVTRSIIALAFFGLLIAFGASQPNADPPMPVTLKTTELGKGPALVFLPDMGFGRMFWMPVARRLIGAHRVVLVDLPGHGESPMLDPFSFAAAAEALDRVLAKLPAESTIVIGQGVGGSVAAVEAQAHPERMRGLVLIDTGLKRPFPIPDQQKQMFFERLQENFDSFLEHMVSKSGRDSVQRLEILAQARLVPKANLITYFKTLLDTDASQALEHDTHAKLYIGSELEWPAEKPWSALAAGRGLPAAMDTLRMPKSGQLIAKDQPDSLAQVIRAFAAKAIAPGK